MGMSDKAVFNPTTMTDYSAWLVFDDNYAPTKNWFRRWRVAARFGHERIRYFDSIVSRKDAFDRVEQFSKRRRTYLIRV